MWLIRIDSASQSVNVVAMPERDPPLPPPKGQREDARRAADMTGAVAPPSDSPSCNLTSTFCGKLI